MNTIETLKKNLIALTFILPEMTSDGWAMEGSEGETKGWFSFFGSWRLIRTPPQATKSPVLNYKTVDILV